jgi:hypothetical protein
MVGFLEGRKVKRVEGGFPLDEKGEAVWAEAAVFEFLDNHWMLLDASLTFVELVIDALAGGYGQQTK